MKCLYLICFSLFLSVAVSAQWTDDVTENVHVANANAADIQTVGTSDGKTWIAFYSQRGGNYDMRAQLLDSTGKKLLGDSGVLVSKKPSGSATYVFNVCINGKGELIIGYQYEINGVLNAVLSKVDQTGQLLWGPNGVVIGPGLSPYPAVLTTSETAVAWNNANSNTVSLQVVAADGTIENDSVVNVLVGNTTTSRGQVVANNDGNFTLLFQKNVFVISTTLYAQRYSHNRKRLFLSPVQLSNQTTSGARYYSLIAEEDTTYVGYYSSVGSRFNAFIQRINPDSTDILPYGLNGVHFSNDTGVNDNYQQTITIAQQDSSAALWAVCTYSDPGQTQYGVYAQRFLKTTGERLLGNKAKKVFTISANLDRQEGNLQLTGEDKPGFITSDVNNHIYATKLDDKGNMEAEASGVLLGGTSKPKSRINFAANDVIAVAVWSEDRGSSELPYAQNITGKGVTGVLPVVISHFAVIKNGNEANLSWNAANETGNNGFYIERSTDGRNFVSIGYAAAKANNTSQSAGYIYTDKLPVAGTNYYRLRQADNNGQITYSETIVVTFDKAASFAVTRLYPNPAKNVINLQAESSADDKAIVLITGANGKILKQQNFTVLTGNNVLPVNIQSLAAGTYFIKISVGSVEKTLTFTKL